MRPSSSKRYQILVIHSLNKSSRQTSVDFTKSFGLHANETEVHYLNVLGFSAAAQLRIQYDLAIITTEVSSLRSFPYWPDVESRILRMSKQARKTVIFTQDDYTYSSRIDNLSSKGSFASIWSPLGGDLKSLYPAASASGVTFQTCLTGYVSLSLIHQSEKAKAFSERTIDLGQRVSFLPKSFGSTGSRKAQIASALASEFLKRGYAVDVSTNPEDVFRGHDWFSFLGDCRFTISRKGGASLADPHNHLTNSLNTIHGNFPFLPDSVAFAFASKRGVLHGEWVAESPRLFEAAAMGVCQILEEDSYLGGLMIPWFHYIPLASDFSNLDEIFLFIRQSEKVEKMILECRKLLNESEAFSYESFISGFLAKELAGYDPAHDAASVVVDLDMKNKPSIDWTRKMVPNYFIQSSLWRLLRDSLSKNPPKPLIAFREITNIEYIPEVFSESWVDVSYFGSTG